MQMIGNHHHIISTCGIKRSSLSLSGSALRCNLTEFCVISLLAFRYRVYLHYRSCWRRKRRDPNPNLISSSTNVTSQIRFWERKEKINTKVFLGATKRVLHTSVIIDWVRSRLIYHGEIREKEEEGIHKKLSCWDSIRKYSMQPTVRGIIAALKVDPSVIPIHSPRLHWSLENKLSPTLFVFFPDEVDCREDREGAFGGSWAWTSRHSPTSRPAIKARTRATVLLFPPPARFFSFRLPLMWSN